MNEFQSNSSIENHGCQELSGALGCSETVKPPQKTADESISVESFTLQESLQLILNALLEESPSSNDLAKYLLNTLKALPGIAESVNAQPDYTDVFQQIADAINRLADAAEEHNRLHREEEPPEDTPQESRPFKPPPTDRGGSKPRREVSPGLKRLRQIEKGGEQP